MEPALTHGLLKSDFFTKPDRLCISIMTAPLAIQRPGWRHFVSEAQF